MYRFNWSPPGPPEQWASPGDRTSGLAAAGASHCTVTAPTLLLGGTASVTGTWDVPMTTTTYGVIVEPSTSSLLGSVSWQVVTKTTTQVTLTVKALVAIASSGTLYLSAVR